MIEIHSVPYDLGGARQGSRLGPGALHLAGLVPTLIEVLRESSNSNPEVISKSRISTDLDVPRGEGLPYAQPLKQVLSDLKAATAATLSRGNLPLMLGGEHSLSAATVSACLDQYGDELAVLWIDAHADINTPGTSETLNVHGMPIALLAGMNAGHKDEKINADWQSLSQVVSTTKLSVNKVSWIGLRDVDEGEQDRVREGFPISMHKVDRYGIEESWNRVVQRIRDCGCKYLYISFDVDVMDPILAPGTGTSVRGGLTYREAHLLAELIHDTLSMPNPPFKLVGLDLVEVSPIHDTNNQTATVTVEWVASLFGKRILKGDL